MADEQERGMNLPAKALSPNLADVSTIPGWGVDSDTENDPTYPIRDQSKDDGLTRNWDRPPIQRPGVEILQSIEHIRQPAVVGTSTPPRGVSGLMRRAAFRWSESNWIHWLMLMGADRVDVVEGVIDDLAHARIPNIPAEMGIRSELKYNKKGFAKKVAVVGIVSAIAVGLLARRRNSKRGQAKASS
jgi:hypothetical protein